MYQVPTFKRLGEFIYLLYQGQTCICKKETQTQLIETTP